MDACTAKRVIESMIYKPGWRFEVADRTDRHQDTISVRVHYPARDFDIAYAPDYAKEITPSAKFPIMVGDCDCEDALFYKLITEVLYKIEDHEMREALRIMRGGEWYAPFHPHNTDSMIAWSSRHGTPVAADLLFGVS